MTNYTINKQGWMTVPGYGKTMWYNSRDLEWLKAGGKPYVENGTGFIILPYGHKSGHKVYTATAVSHA